MKLLKYATLLRILYDEKSRNFIILLKKNHVKLQYKRRCVELSIYTMSTKIDIPQNFAKKR